MGRLTKIALTQLELCLAFLIWRMSETERDPEIRYLGHLCIALQIGDVISFLVFYLGILFILAQMQMTHSDHNLPTVSASPCCDGRAPVFSPVVCTQ